MSVSIPTVVLGASGYVGGELLRLIAGHPVFSLQAPGWPYFCCAWRVAGLGGS
jgi:uncharacterized protein YbjT (DUF2867 family)